MLSVRTPSHRDEQIEQTLREVVERLAAIERAPCSSGEREAAQWLARRLAAAGAVEVTLEDEPSWGTFPPTVTALGLLGVIAAALVIKGKRLVGALLALASAGGVIDEAQNGPRLVRRGLRRRRRTVNVVACLGDSDAPSTLVVLAHHDAPQTGLLFDQSLQKRIYQLAPQLIERAKTPLPQWWIGLAGPLASVLSALSRRRGGAIAGLVIGLAGSALVADVWRSETVVGANDNLSGAAALVALAELLERHPIPAMRVLLVSCGAEETLQDGIRAFMARHRSELDPKCTSFVNLDTIGSPHLLQLEGEGPIWMEDYSGPWLRELLANEAEQLGISLRRGFRARSSTDSVIPSRGGYPIATLLSMTDWGSPANYHLPSDVPENLQYGTVAQAVALVHAVAGALAARARR
jgi:Peptidase family M28